MAPVDGLARPRAGDVVDRLRLRLGRDVGAPRRHGQGARLRCSPARRGCVGVRRPASPASARLQRLRQVRQGSRRARALDPQAVRERGPAASVAHRLRGARDRRPRPRSPGAEAVARRIVRLPVPPLVLGDDPRRYQRDPAQHHRRAVVGVAPLRIAVLVKQVPKFEAMELGPGGRLVREGLELELNPYCRRAVSKGAELAAATGGTSTVFTLGPPSAEDCLREAIAWGVDEGVLISDVAFAGSDTLATARALAAALEREGPFDLVLAGRNSVDADTGQVGPEVAALLDLPFVTGVRHIDLGEGLLRVVCEEDDGHSERTVSLPAVVTTAERLCEPAKVDPAGRAAVPAERIRVVRAADLGPGPWGEDGSGTYVGEVRLLEIERAHIKLSGPVEAQVDEAVRLLVARGALTETRGNSRAYAPA